MDGDQPADLRTQQGDILARGRLHRHKDGTLEFLPTPTGNRLVGYFFGIGSLVRLHAGGSRPLRVRLNTRWVDGSRRWSLSPAGLLPSLAETESRESA